MTTAVAPVRRVETLFVAAIVTVMLVVIGGVTAAAAVAIHSKEHQPIPAAAPLMMEVVGGTLPISHQVSVQRTSATQSMGHWTPTIGVQIAQRAVNWLGWPYAFGAGNAAGPTYGVPVDADSANDGHIFGWDCSGLTMYAVGPWLQLDHLASKQYAEVGSYHPALNQLKPGDFIFWSKDATVDGIGHVAVYIGNGKVVQAPHSGAVVTITPLHEVEAGAIGTTRPLS